MKGDFTRHTFDPRKQYSRVLLQQGRVHLDADFNEQAAILLHYLRMLSVDLMGEHWGVGESFQISSGNRLDFLIRPGHYYVNGILCEFDAPRPRAYTEQPEYPHPTRLKERQSYVVYLDVWERHVTHIEDPSIREAALGGPDTATRAKVVWQVKVLPWMGQAGEDETRHLTMLLSSRGTARLRARAGPQRTPEDPSIMTPEPGYRGAENQLYRVEAHTGGPVGQATFKWSRDNGSVVFPIREVKGKVVTLEHLGRSTRFGLAVGDWVEIVDDDYVLMESAEPLLRVEAIDPIGLVTLSHPPASTAGQRPADHPLIRRWDHKPTPNARGPYPQGGVLPIREGEWLDLEVGVQILFETGGNYRTGDYWTIPARTATGDVEWPGPTDDPDAAEPHGVVHAYAPLAVISIDEHGNVNVDEDCRRTFGLSVGTGR